MQKNGWYIVPDDVTAITVEAVYGRAIYIRSPYDNMYYDEYHIWYYGTNNDGTSTLDGNAVEKSSDNNDGSSIDNSISTLKRAYELIKEDANAKVYETAVVLCGDLYEVNIIYSDKANSVIGESGTYKKYFSNYLGYNTSEKKPITIKSPNDQHYSLYMLSYEDYNIYSSVRFDNLYIQHLPVSKIIDRYEDNIYPETYVIRRRFQLAKNNITFEILETNTTDSKISYLWYTSGVKLKIYAGTWRAIASGWSNNGSFTRTISNNTCVIIGGTTYIYTITAGIGNDYSDGQKKIQINSGKINITGGIIINVYSSSLGLDCDIKGDTYLYINGGKIGNLFGASYGNVCAYNGVKGNVNIFVYGGIINNIYGAGQRYTSNIDGDVNLVIKNAQVIGNIYGGGKGGTVSGNVKIDVDNLNVKGNIYGAGYGLTDEISNTINATANSAQNSFEEAINSYNNMINKKGGTSWNVAPSGFPVYNTDEDYIITSRYHSASLQENAYHLREIEYRDSLTLSTVEGNVSINIKNSNIQSNLYGGGEISVVNGDADINVYNSTVNGNIYGGGNGSTVPSTVKLYKPLDNSSYQEITQVGKTDSKKLIGEFTWTNEERILKYFKGIYDGKNQAIYDGTSETKSFSELLEEYKNSDLEGFEEISSIIQKYSNKQLIYSSNADKLGAIGGNIKLNLNNVKVSEMSYICGGGNKGKVNGKTEVILENMNNISNVYAGGYTGEVVGDTQITINSGMYSNIFGGGYSGNVLGNSKLKINKGIFANIFGGGDQSYVKGSTDVTIGQENSNANIDVTGLVYGGGRGYDADNDGDASDFTTVYGNSKVLIQGVNTSVENYGSTKLGAVNGNVDVNFKNYWSGNSTAKYQKMNGIDRATTVSFENSYVLLENKDLNGNLVGIQSIENLKIPKGSGLKISANGEITGNFEGGGELYLDSLVCLTVRGNITGQTTMVLNPELMESGTQLIRGGIKAPYLKVKGTAPEAEQIALVSGEPNKYKIMQASKEAVKETIGEDYIYYYIAEDIIIENDITVSSNSVAERSYKSAITNTEDQYILNSGIFSTDVGVDYYLTNSAYKSKDYTNITRKLKLISNSNNSKTVKFPEGTEVLMLVNNEYYYYIVGASTVSEISLSDFKKSDETTAKYNELKDITNSDLVTKTYNEIKGTTSYAFKENYKFIFSFENTNGIEEDTYYPSIEVYYSGSLFGDAKKDVANNIVNLQKREYSAELSKDREYYESNGIINLTGNITVSEVNVKTVLPTDILNLRLKLQNSNGKEIAIPQGTQIKLNEQEGLIQDGQATIKWPQNIGTTGQTENINITLDMTGVLPQNRLPKDNYTIKLEYQDNKKYKNLVEIQANIIDEQTKYGVSTKVNQMEGIAEDKIQLIEQGQEIRRSIKVSSSNSSELKNMKLKIKVEEKTEEFEYQETANSKKISVDTQEISMTEQNLEQDVNIMFGENTQNGIYRIVVELYDEYGKVRTQDYVNFIVSE